MKPRLSGSRLEVDSFVGERHALELNAQESRPGERVSLGVEVEEQRGEIEFERATGIRADADALGFDARLRRATLAPPPFAGHATFRRGAEPANRWTGNLTVDLPGRSDVPLTGPGLRISLVHARS